MEISSLVLIMPANGCLLNGNKTACRSMPPKVWRSAYKSLIIFPSAFGPKRERKEEEGKMEREMEMRCSRQFRFALVSSYNETQKGMYPHYCQSQLRCWPMIAVNKTNRICQNFGTRVLKQALTEAIVEVEKASRLKISPRLLRWTE